MQKRWFEDHIFSEAWGRQMRFIAGPRQCGKTTLAKSFLKLQGSASFYYNWDSAEVKERFARGEDFIRQDVLPCRKAGIKPWVCYDEIHKMPKWKNILKGQFDAYENSVRFAVTGSAKLNWFRRSGDSLAGRYFSFRLFPFNLHELTRRSGKRTEFFSDARAWLESRTAPGASHQKTMEHLLNYGGFPEPFLKQDAGFHRIWQRDYLDSLIKTDLRDLTRIAELQNIASLVQLLPERIGSPLSVNSLREDLFLSHETVANYLRALELVCYVFSVPVYSRNISRSLKKEKKVYFYDWSMLKDAGKRFENYVACELAAWTAFFEDSGLAEFELHYLRNRESKECDFLITKDHKPWLMAEAKLSPENTPSHHLLFSKKLGDVPVVQLVQKEGVLRASRDGSWTISASRFFSE